MDPDFDPAAYIKQNAPPANSTPAASDDFSPADYIKANSENSTEFDPHAYAQNYFQESGKQMASQPGASPESEALGHAEGTPEYETAFHADQALKNRTLGEKASAALHTAGTASPWVEGAKGLGKFAAGLVGTPVHTGIQALEGYGAQTASYLGADDVAEWLAQHQLRNKAEAVLSGQKVEEGLGQTARAITNLKPTGAGDPYGSPDTMAEGMSETTPEELKAANERRARDDFNARIKSLQNQQQLAQGRPLDTGAVATLSNLSGTPTSELTPEALEAAGAPKTRPFVTESMAAAGNPENLALAAVPALPGAKIVAGGGAELLGKAMQLPMRGLEALPGKLGKFGRAAASPIGLATEAGVGALTHPELTAKVAGGVLALKMVQKLGQVAEAAGNEFRTGLPGQFTRAAELAQNSGQTAYGAQAARVLGNAAVTGAATAYGMAPLSLLQSEGDPEKFTNQEIGAGIFGAGLGALHSRASLRDMDANLQGELMAQHGQTKFTDNPDYAAHQATMDKLSPSDQTQINKLRSYLWGGTGTDVLVVDGPTFAKAAGSDIGQDARGKISDDGKTIYVNGDVAQARAKKGGTTPGEEASQTTGHETGHAVVKWLQDASRSAEATALTQSIRDSLTPEQMQQMTDAYHQALLKSTKTTPANSAETLARIQRDNPPEQILEENLAEITRNILAGKDVSKFALPRSVLDTIADSSSNLLNQLGMGPQVPADASLGFKMRNVRATANRMQDMLYEVGARARATRAAGPTAEQTVRELRQRLSDLPQPTPNMPADQAQALTANRDALQKRIDAWGQVLTPKPTFPAAGRPPTPPSAPAAPLPPVFDRNAPIPPILAQKAPKPSVSPASAPSAKNETPTTNQPLPASPVVATPSTVAAPAAATAVQDKVAAPVAERKPPEPAKPAVTEEQAKQIVTNAEQAATAAEKKPNTKAAQGRIRQAKIGAVMDAIGEDPNGLHRETDEFGNTRITGNFDPENPMHQVLAGMAGVTKPAQEKLTQMQDAQGTPVYIRYRSAKSDTAGEGGEGSAKGMTDMDVRRKEYEADEASKRTEGQPQHKVVIPLGTEVTGDKGAIVSKFLTLDNLLHNAESIGEGMKEAGIPNPYAGKENELVQDANAYARNHANGYRGDGSGLIKQFPDSNLPQPVQSYEPAVIPKDRFDVLNMMLHNETAGRLGTLTERIQNDAAAGKETPKSIRTQYQKAQEAYALAEENDRWIDHTSGETNQLRAQLKAAGFDTAKRFKSPFETLSPQHILEVSENPIPLQPGDIPSVRPTGFDVDPAELAKSGMPNMRAAAAGFQPNEDTGAPEQGGTPSERLAREAEQAGVVLKTEDMKNLMREDPATLARIRSRIQQNTGQPARFQPDEKEMFMASRGDYSSDPKPPFYLASKREYAKNFGDNIKTFRAAPKNPLDLTNVEANADDGGTQLKGILEKNGISTKGLRIFSDDELAQALNRNLPELSSRIKAAGFDSAKLNEYVENGGSDQTLLILDKSALSNNAPKFQPDERYGPIAEDVWDSKEPTKPEAPTDEGRADIQKAYRELVQERGFPNVPIADVMERAGFGPATVALGKKWIAYMYKNGEIPQLSTGDWSLSDPRKQAWGMWQHEGDSSPMLMMKMRGFQPNESGIHPNSKAIPRASLMAQDRRRKRELQAAQ